MERLLRLLLRETELLEMEHSIHDKVRREIERNNKEYYLREQLKAIQAELGQPDLPMEYDELLRKIKKAKMPKEIEKKAISELDRLAKMPQMSAEATDCLILWLKQHQDIVITKNIIIENQYFFPCIKKK